MFVNLISFSLKFLIHFKTLIYCMCMHGCSCHSECVNAHIHITNTEVRGQLAGATFSFHHGPRDYTQFAILEGKHLYPMSHLAGLQTLHF